jgi:hypothetical protein
MPSEIYFGVHREFVCEFDSMSATSRHATFGLAGNGGQERLALPQAAAPGGRREARIFRRFRDSLYRRCTT